MKGRKVLIFWLLASIILDSYVMLTNKIIFFSIQAYIELFEENIIEIPAWFSFNSKVLCLLLSIILDSYVIFSNKIIFSLFQTYIEFLEENNIQIPAWFSFNSKDGVNVVGGDSFIECVALADSCPNVVAVGINCTPPHFIHGLILSI